MKPNRKQERRQAADAWYSALAERPDLHRLPTGEYYEILTSSDVAPLAAAHVVTCRYTGRLTDGRIFDSNAGDAVPAAFRISELIPGFANALRAMSPGATWRVYIPWTAAYGPKASGPVPAYAPLIFDITLVSAM